MPTLNILGRDCEVRALTPPELSQWNAYISRLHADTYWPELYESIKGLPADLQQVIVGRSPLPAKIDRLRYFDLATQVKSVKLLIRLILPGPGYLTVTPENAAEIFWTLQPMILAKPVVLSGGEGLAKMREETADAGLSR